MLFQSVIVENFEEVIVFVAAELPQRNYQNEAKEFQDGGQGHDAA